MERMAGRVGRETIEKIRGLLPESTDDQRVAGLRNRLRRMQEELEQLEGLVEIRDQSRHLQTDEIVWQTFEDIAWMLGIEGSGGSSAGRRPVSPRCSPSHQGASPPFPS